MFGRQTFRELGEPGKRQVAIFYGWLAVVTALLVLLEFSRPAVSPESIQAQRRHSVRLACERGDTKHHELFVFSRHERERVASEHLTGKFLAREVKVLARIERRDGILQPWEDCPAKVAKLVPGR